MVFKKIIWLIGFANVYFLHAQIPSNVVKVAAFLQEIPMGNIPVDDMGKPLKNGSDTVYFLIIETKGKQVPQWKTAYKAGLTYTLSKTDSTKSDKDEMFASRGQIMKAGIGNRLWKYEMVLSDTAKGNCNTKKGQIILEGKYNNRTINIPIKTITTLPPEIRP